MLERLSWIFRAREKNANSYPTS